MTCEICGCLLAESHGGKENHMKIYHSVKLLKKVVRPKAVVVADWEARNERWIVDWRQCEVNCKCAKCFQAALDRLVEATEVKANVSRTRAHVNDEL